MWLFSFGFENLMTSYAHTLLLSNGKRFSFSRLLKHNLPNPEVRESFSIPEPSLSASSAIASSKDLEGEPNVTSETSSLQSSLVA